METNNTYKKEKQAKIGRKSQKTPIVTNTPLHHHILLTALLLQSQYSTTAVSTYWYCSTNALVLQYRYAYTYSVLEWYFIIYNLVLKIQYCTDCVTSLPSHQRMELCNGFS